MRKKRYLELSDTDTPGDDLRSRRRWPEGETLGIREGPETFVHDRNSILELRVRWQHTNNDVHTQPTGLRIRTTLDWTSPHQLIVAQPGLEYYRRFIGGIVIPTAPADHDPTTDAGIYHYLEVRVREARIGGQLTQWSGARLYPIALTSTQATIVTAELEPATP